MWLSKPIYEGLPYYYIAGGFAMLVVGFYVRHGYWPLVCTSAGVIGLVAGLAIWLKRRDYRASRSRIDFEDTR